MLRECDQCGARADASWEHWGCPQSSTHSCDGKLRPLTTEMLVEQVLRLVHVHGSQIALLNQQIHNLRAEVQVLRETT
jgi:hypothetical protein